MRRLDFIVECEIAQSGRVKQLEALFEITSSKKSSVHIQGDLPIDERDWNIGLIVGPSGAGKSTSLERLFGKQKELTWSNKSVIDDFDKSLSMMDISTICQSVGFNTIPAWLRPYSVLSTGEKFRVDVARRIIETQGLVVIDEFTSVVDRQVAKIASHSIQKVVRKQNKQLVAAGCHYDVIDWLQPDWIFEPHLSRFRWRSVRQRPKLEGQIRRVGYEAWKVFAPYHYMSTELNPSAQCYALIINDEMVAFLGMIHFLHPSRKNIKRVSRIVTLPEWQGMGLAFILSDAVASAYSALGYEVRNYPGHPSYIRSLQKSDNWMCVRSNSKPSGSTGKTSSMGKDNGFGKRFVAVFKYIGPKMSEDEARSFMDAPLK